MNTAKAGQVGVTFHLLNPTLDEAAALGGRQLGHLAADLAEPPVADH